MRLEYTWKPLRKHPVPDTQLERIRLTIWASQDPNGPTAADLKSSGFPPTTIYYTANRLERIGEIERVKVDGKFHFKPTPKSPFVSSPAQDLLVDQLRSMDTDVSSQAWRDLNALSMGGRITSDALLKYLVQKPQAESERVLRILTRQAVLAHDQNDAGMRRKLKLLLGTAENLARVGVDMNTRDAAFLFLKVLDLPRALKLALSLIARKNRDEDIDSDPPTQFWVDVSGTIQDAASTQSVRTQLYNLISSKDPLPAQRAKKLLQATNQPFSKLHTIPSSLTTPKSGRKRGENLETEQGSTGPNDAESG